MRVCGRRGCVERVPFPDKFDGVDESDCMCDNATARCDATSIADPHRFDYCYPRGGLILVCFSFAEDSHPHVS